jgi:hypothetical protein
VLARKNLTGDGEIFRSVFLLNRTHTVLKEHTLAVLVQYDFRVVGVACVIVLNPLYPLGQNRLKVRVFYAAVKIIGVFVDVNVPVGFTTVIFTRAADADELFIIRRN